MEVLWGNCGEVVMAVVSLSGEVWMSTGGLSGFLASRGEWGGREDTRGDKFKAPNGSIFMPPFWKEKHF